MSLRTYECLSFGVDITESFGVEPSACPRTDLTAFGEAVTRQIWPYPAHNDCSRLSESTSRSFSASKAEATSCGDVVLGIVVVEGECLRML